MSAMSRFRPICLHLITRLFQEREALLGKGGVRLWSVPCPRWLMCFSLIRNYRRVFSLNPGKEAIPCLNGIRTLRLAP